MMLILGLNIGIYSYIILVIGLLGLLNPFVVITATASYLLILFFFFKDNLKTKIPSIKLNRLEKSYMFLIAGLFGTGILGVLGPEIGFDALWYHLTIPKIYIQRETINFIEGNLFYYSLLPRLAEMLYIPALMFGSGVIAKFVHFIFGVLASIGLYQLSRLYLNRQWALLSVLIFNSNLVVAWLLTSSYIDLARVLYEVTALFYILKFTLKKKDRYLIASAILLGFAIATKIVSLVTLPVFIIIILLFSKNSIKAVVNTIKFIVITLTIPLPWFLIAMYYKHNPVYPIFSSSAPQRLSIESIYPLSIINNIKNVFLFSSDPINPLYLIIIPLVFLMSIRNFRKVSVIVVYSALTMFFWYITSFLGFWHATGQAGSARFLTAYLPAYSTLVVFIVYSIKNNRVQNLIIAAIVIIAISSIVYRIAASAKYIPVIIGFESKQNFLMSNLDFKFGDFYDENNEIKKIVNEDLVLLHGMHNLYYVNFNYTLPEWENANKAKYVLVQNGELDKLGSTLLYQNTNTHVKLYKL